MGEERVCLEKKSDCVSVRVNEAVITVPVEGNSNCTTNDASLLVFIIMIITERNLR